MGHSSNSIISDTARIAKTAVIGEHVTIEDYAVIEENVTIGDHCHIRSHSVIRANSTLAIHVLVDSFCVIGGDPGIINFDWFIKSGVVIGAHTRLEKASTSSLKPIGHTHTLVDTVLMSQCQGAHDCVVNDHVHC